MPLQATSGAASYDAFGGGVPVVPAYIEDVFSTYVYAGNGSTQTVTNNIDLSTQGGLIWIKCRTNSGGQHILFDTARGVNKYINTNDLLAQTTDAGMNLSFLSTGFSLNNLYTDTNASGQNYVAWTFRKKSKFFDIVTYTGNGTSGRSIAHNLGSMPGCVIIKRLNSTSNWIVWHRGVTTPTNPYFRLNSSIAVDTYSESLTPTSTTFIAGNSGAVDDDMNASAGTYVAYLFAHDAGGFGLTGTDNGISCGTFTTGSGGNATVTLGYEPQWVLYKLSSAGDSWFLVDTMRGMPIITSSTSRLVAQTTGAEQTLQNAGVRPFATGFTAVGLNGSAAGGIFIYIAIRKGPMKVPTTGGSVFGMSARSGTGANATVTGGQTDDAVLVKNRGSAVASLFSTRLTQLQYLVTSTTAAEAGATSTILQPNPWDVMDGVKVGTTSTITNASGNTFVNYLFKRAPSFMDVVCYTGTGVAKTEAHNLGAVPELMIVKQRSSARDWAVYTSATTATNFMYLNATDASGASSSMWNDTTPTASVFTVGTNLRTNVSAGTYVAYLFATCAGVSKVGSYTGNGTTQTIDCGLTAGARFVLIKRTDAVGDWYVYDTARGMTTLTDPYWLTNSSAAEVATLGSVTTVATGFALNSTILAAINVNAGTYIFLAIA